MAAPAIGVGLGVALQGWDELPFLAGGSNGATEPAEHRNETGDEPTADSPPEAAQAPPLDTSDPGSVPQSDSFSDEPVDAVPEQSPVPAEPTTVSSAELEDAFEGYIRAWDSGDIARAYALLSEALKQQDGWSYEQFATFRNESITGSRVVSIDDVDATAQRVDATVHFQLPDGGVSQETLRTHFAHGVDDDLLLDDYEVLAADRID